MPEVSFSPDELAVLGLAARAWQQASLSHAAGTAVLKLRADGVDPDESALLGLEPRVGAAEEAFAPLWAAVRDRYPVRFTYRGPRDAAPAGRSVEPWGLLSRSGRWLPGRTRPRPGRVPGFPGRPGGGRRDRGRGVGLGGGPAGYRHPRPVARMDPPRPREVATVRVRGRSRPGPASPGESGGVGRRGLGPAGAPLIATADQLAAEVIAYGPAVVVLGPDAARNAVRGAPAGDGCRRRA